MQERYSELLTCIYNDYAGLCGVQPDYRDINKLSRRCHHEGKHFAEIVLPQLGRSLEQALERGFVEPTDFEYFSKTGKCPRLFGVFFALIFDGMGQLRADCCVTAVAAIRQLSYTFKKVKEVCDAKKVDEAFRRYRAIEQEVSCNNAIPGDWQHKFDAVSRILWSGLRDFNPFDSIPRHGPGAVAEGVQGYFKFSCIRQQWYDRLEAYFPYDSFAISSLEHVDIIGGCQPINEEKELPVRVIAVPKTAAKPRIIAIEPACMQYSQQAVSGWLIPYLETRNAFTRGHVNFTDQTINAELALQSSLTREFATLDMSEASEWVPLAHIEYMLRHAGDFFDIICACRSTKADLNGETIKLSKFASMGSALCFPIESMYFYTLCICGLLKEQEPTFSAIKTASERVYIYGDDIVIPTDSAPDVMACLIAFGNKVNQDKSFWKGYFRESCGQDAFQGSDVTPVYVRKHVPSSRASGDWLSLVETANQFFKIGLWRSANCIDSKVRAALGEIPVALDNHPSVHFTSFCGQPFCLGLSLNRRRYNHRYHRIQYRCLVVSMPYKRQKLCEVSDFLLASFLRLEQRRKDDPVLNSGGFSSTTDKTVIEANRKDGRIVRRGAGTLKYRWI